MNKNDHVKYFATQLTQRMCEKGYQSERFKTGIDIQKLAAISGSSYQMARKYALGEVLPDISIIIKIAHALDCEPGCLLFGDSTQHHHQSAGSIIIEKEVLKYILSKSVDLLEQSHDTETVINFIVETAYDATHLDVDTKTLHKIIDMMISSATLLNKTDQDDALCTK